MVVHRICAHGILLFGLGAAIAAEKTPSRPSDPASSSHVSVLTGDQVVQILDETVDWYRTLGTQQQTSSQPSDLLILYANQQTASQVVGLAFEIARANAELLSSEASSAPAAPDETSRSGQTLDALEIKLKAQRQTIQGEMASERHQTANSRSAGKSETEAKLSELQGELDMINARLNLLDTMSQFVSESNAKTASANALKAHIDAIAASVPTAGVTPSTAAAAAPAATTAPATAAKSTAPAAASLLSGSSNPSGRVGIWGLATDVIRLSEKAGTIDAIDRRTAALEATFSKIRNPPLERLKALSAESDGLATQADSAHGAALKAVRDQLDTLAWLFQQTSAILIPLSKEGVLLEQYRHNLKSWHDAVERQYHDALKALGIRVGILLLMLAIVFAGAEVWRRLVLKYTVEPRRRYQQLLVRKLTTWALVIVIIAFTFITELSSFATFAGLLTAGLAVAMQSVLVSLVGYFFLIGKYGIRVGDRVQIGNVSGEVIDLGLVRMHLMELSPQGPLGATGRVVAFANSIVFQASGGLFKQIPGVNFVWHERTLSLPADCDYVALKERLLSVVREIVKDYDDDLSRQTKQIAKATASSSVGNAAPQIQMHYSATAVEAQVRYPVPLNREAEVDERVSEALMKVVSSSARIEHQSK